MAFPEDGNEETNDTEGDLPEGDSDQDDASGGQSAEEKLISQKELERVLAKRLKRQEDQFLKKYGDYDSLKEAAEAYAKIQDEKATDAERWEREVNSLKAALTDRDEKLTKLERSSLISDLATDKGLPKSFWKRVSGDSPEEIEEDIESIINDLGIKTEPEDSKSKKTPATRKKAVYGGGGENEPPDPDTDEIVSKIPRGPQFRVTRN